MQFFTFKMAAILQGQGHCSNFVDKVLLTPSNVSVLFYGNFVTNIALEKSEKISN